MLTDSFIGAANKCALGDAAAGDAGNVRRWNPYLLSGKTKMFGARFE